GKSLKNLLKLSKAHKWCYNEWFYSNIDKALFDGDSEFVLCLKESFPGLKTRKLTRFQWGLLRRLMGRPRRCSATFFEEERNVLKDKRQKIRSLQQKKTIDLELVKDLPEEIPPLLVVGTSVTAFLRNPQRGLFTGRIEAVDTANKRYRITFDRPGLGTHYIDDTEVLSEEPVESIFKSSLVAKQRPRSSSSLFSNVTPPRSVRQTPHFTATVRK
ncbi:uncharacterized protein TRIADDRAFT_19868, partial [Trichoplax adhaerens]